MCALLSASDRAILGHVDFTAEEIAADLRRPDLEAYGWYAGTRLVGYGWAARSGGGARVDVDVYVHPDHDQALGLEILELLEGRAAARAAEVGHRTAILDIGVYRQDERTRRWMTERGYTCPTRFVRMRIDLDGRTQHSSATGSGVVVVRRSDGTAEDLRRAHRISEDSFVDHYGHEETPFDIWHQRLTEQGPDWAEVWFAEVDGEPVGLLVGTRQFLEEENAGYVRTLGTLAQARGLGAGTALLRAYFDACQQAGRSAVLLHVDAQNVTGALRLYEAVGMRAVLTIDAWTRTVTA